MFFSPPRSAPVLRSTAGKSAFTIRARTTAKLRSPAAQKWVVCDLDFQTGKIRWQRELRSAVSPIAKHVKNSFASETPVTDGERVYVYFATVGLLAALDLNGQIVWTKDIGARNGASEYGTGSSPAAAQGSFMYIVNDNSTQSFLAAFDQKTGKELWRSGAREKRTAGQLRFIWENDLRTEIVTAATEQSPFLRSRRPTPAGS